MFWPTVIAAPLWHCCSLDHLKPNEMWWGRNKGSVPSISAPSSPLNIHQALPSSFYSSDNPQLGCSEQRTPLDDILLRTIARSDKGLKPNSSWYSEYLILFFFISNILPRLISPVFSTSCIHPLPAWWRMSNFLTTGSCSKAPSDCFVLFSSHQLGSAVPKIK